MKRWLARCAGLGAVLTAVCAGAPVAAACGATALGEAKVIAIPDSHTLALGDGRLVKLAGIAWMVPADAARSALADQLLNRTVSLKGNATPDRYGRIYAFPIVSGSETPIQYALVEQGLAVPGGRIGDQACVSQLLEREQVAQSSGRGAWASGKRRHNANDPKMILSDQGRFAIVEGRVLSVRESGSIIYVNFGRRWSEDFTVTIAKRNEATFIREGLPPRSLSGRDVRVRGFVEERSGPWIEATRPEQVEVVAAR